MNNNNGDSIEKLLTHLDDEDIDALGEMVAESPELLRQTLEEYGYLDGNEYDEDGFLVNEQATELSEAQQDLLDHLQGQLDPPKTVAEIRDIVGAEDSAFRQQYSSAQHRSWLSEQLKALSDAGDVGRYRDGRTVLYAKTPELAVRHWARINEQFPQDLSVADAPEIRNDTEMPGRVIKNAIRSITNV